MNANQDRPFKIVAALDVSKLADAVVVGATEAASQHRTCEIHLLTVSARDDEETLGMLHRHLADVAAAQLRGMPAGERRMRVHVRPGDAAEEIQNLVLEVEPDLLVIGGALSSGRHHHLGKIATRVVESVPCPVMLVRVPDYGPHPLRAKQCPACVAVRAETGGERWFCDEHSTRGSLTSAVLSPHSEPALGGGLLL